MVLVQKRGVKLKQKSSEEDINATTKLKKEIMRLNKKYEARGLSKKYLCEAAEAVLNKKLINQRGVTYKVISDLICIIVLLCNFLHIFWLTSNPTEKCLLPATNLLKQIVRPRFACDYCKGLTQPKIFGNLSKEEFRPHAYKQYPMILKDAVSHWPAKEIFDFYFFKDLYDYFPYAHSYNFYEGCSYFSYESEISTLQDVFTMNDSKVFNKNGEKSWYVGWTFNSFWSAESTKKKTLKKSIKQDAGKTKMRMPRRKPR